MKLAADARVDEDALNRAVVEIKLCVNRRLFEKNAITEEMYTRAKELILKDEKYISVP